MKVKLLQWNILYKEKIDNILGFLEQVKADILCLQELTANHEANNKIDTSKFLADNLDLNSYSVIAHKHKDGDVINGIFSKFKMKNNHSFFVQKPAREDDYSSFGRNVIASEIEINSKSVKVATTHLSYVPKFHDTPQKNIEVDNLLKYLKKQDKNFILTGDLNATPDTRTIKEIMKTLKNCGPELSKPTWATKPFEYKGFSEDKLRWRLNYVFSTHDIEIVSARMLETEFSDHLPIMVEFKI